MGLLKRSSHRKYDQKSRRRQRESLGADNKQEAGYDSQKTRDELEARGMKGEIAHKGDKAPIPAGQRWHVERTNSWHNGFNRLQRCYERHEEVIDAFFDLADAIITVRSLIRQSWTLYRWDSRPAKRP
jgi:Transposase DDE domain